jgi:hypothetical protein
MKGGNQNGVRTISLGWLQYFRRGTLAPQKEEEEEEEITFLFYGKRNEIHQFGTGFFCTSKSKYSSRAD